MNTIGKTEAKQIHEAMRAKAGDCARELGLSVAKCACTYDPGSGTCKVTVELVTDTMNGKPREQAEFERNAMAMIVNPALYRAKVHLSGEDYIIIGLNLRATDRPVIVQNAKTGNKARATLTALGKAVIAAPKGN